MRLNLPITDIEYPVPEGEILVSKTDLNGIITYCNLIFVKVSGYSREELIGSPHNLLRHPDMPPEAFADMWKSNQANKPWRGLVKNRRKDGRYYWVEANVTPLIENGKTVGYVSFRYTATPEKIAQTAAAYEEIRAGSSRLRINDGEIVPAENLLLRWWNASSIKFRLFVFMSALLIALVTIGVFNLQETSNANHRAIDGLAVAGVQAYALDTARITELNFKEQLQTWQNILIRGHDAATLEKYLKEFQQQGDEVEYKLSLLKPVMQQIGLPTNSVDIALISHAQLIEQYHRALQSFDIHKPETGMLVDSLVKDADRATIQQIEMIVTTIRDAQHDGLGDLNAALESAHDAEKHAPLRC